MEILIKAYSEELLKFLMGFGINSLSGSKKGLLYFSLAFSIFETLLYIVAFHLSPMLILMRIVLSTSLHCVQWSINKNINSPIYSLIIATILHTIFNINILCAMIIGAITIIIHLKTSYKILDNI